MKFPGTLFTNIMVVQIFCRLMARRAATVQAFTARSSVSLLRSSLSSFQQTRRTAFNSTTTVWRQSSEVEEDLDISLEDILGDAFPSPKQAEGGYAVETVRGE